MLLTPLWKTLNSPPNEVPLKKMMDSCGNDRLYIDFAEIFTVDSV